MVVLLKHLLEAERQGRPPPNPYGTGVKDQFPPGSSYATAVRLVAAAKAKGVLVLSRGLEGLKLWRGAKTDFVGALSSTGIAGALGGWPNSVRDTFLKCTDRGLVPDVPPESVAGKRMRRGHAMEDLVISNLVARTGWGVLHHYPGRSADLMVAHPTLMLMASPDGHVMFTPQPETKAALQDTSAFRPKTKDESASLDELPPLPARPGSSHLPKSMAPLRSTFVSMPDTLRRYRDFRRQYERCWEDVEGGQDPLLAWGDKADSRAALEIKVPQTRYVDVANTKFEHMLQMQTSMMLSGLRACVYVVAVTLRDHFPGLVDAWLRKGQVKSNLRLLGLLGSLGDDTPPEELTEEEVADALRDKLRESPSFGSTAMHLDVYLVRAHPPVQATILDFARRATPLICRHRIQEEAYRKAVRDASARATQRASQDAREAIASAHDDALRRKKELMGMWKEMCGEYHTRAKRAWNGGKPLRKDPARVAVTAPFVQALDMDCYGE